MGEKRGELGKFIVAAVDAGAEGNWGEVFHELYLPFRTLLPMLFLGGFLVEFDDWSFTIDKLIPATKIGIFTSLIFLVVCLGFFFLAIFYKKRRIRARSKKPLKESEKFSEEDYLKWDKKWKIQMGEVYGLLFLVYLTFMFYEYIFSNPLSILAAILAYYWVVSRLLKSYYLNDKPKGVSSEKK